MNKEQLAEILNNCEYREEISEELQEIAKNNNLVVVFGASDDLVVFGASDDLMELRGAIYDEFGSEVYILNKKVIQLDDNFRGDMDNQIEFLRKYIKEKIYTIDSLYGNFTDDISWTYKTDIPHAKFNVLEDGEVYCEGIVFSLDEME